ncbi:MAG: lycopene cyclase [Ferruginibacter sp.]|nr:lycopene cyclase [Cytophagales bacterium]
MLPRTTPFLPSSGPTPPVAKHYDYVIAGAGCAGLSLAYHLNQTRLRNQSILLIDQVRKETNDRTWSFWEAGDGPFEAVVWRQWSDVHFHGAAFSARLDLSPYRYKMVRGIDFYRFVAEDLRKNPNVSWAHETIVAIEENGSGARVHTEGGVYHADWVFDSTRAPRLDLPHRHNLLQHFKGWEIETPEPVFDPAVATLMDFRIEQKEQARFFYVLPSDPRRALVEFTVFSERLLDPAEYEAELRQYLKNFLRVDRYRVEKEEFGVIPMTDEPLTERASEHVFRIGTAGGYTKPSSGYTFVRIQQRTQAIVRALLDTGQPASRARVFQSRFGWYDSALLNVMQERRYEAREIFTQLFRKNPPATVLRFLDESTTFPQELRIMASVPPRPFLAAVAEVVWKRVRSRVG